MKALTDMPILTEEVEEKVEGGIDGLWMVVEDKGFYVSLIIPAMGIPAPAMSVASRAQRHCRQRRWR